jgi:sulfur-oxidizing protein SoxA
MLLNVVKSTVLVALTTCVLNAGEFNAQAEKDRIALVDYTIAKFKDADKNRDKFFPYSTDSELKTNIKKDVSFDELRMGNYAFSLQGQYSYNAINEMPPYYDLVEKGEVIYNNNEALQKCFPDVTVAGNYPYFDEKKKEVVSLTGAVNECLTNDGQKAWNEKKGKMAIFQSYIASETQDAEKKVDIKILSAAAAAAYERGKEYYYTQRGYLKLSCATCHVQGAGKRVRNESLSQLAGQTTHFPVYRLKWGVSKVENGLGTLERRMSGCIKDQGQVPPKTDSKEMKELLYFMAYMSNEMNVDGPDIRK